MNLTLFQPFEIKRTELQIVNRFKVVQGLINITILKNPDHIKADGDDIIIAQICKLIEENADVITDNEKIFFELVINQPQKEVLIKDVNDIFWNIEKLGILSWCLGVSEYKSVEERFGETVLFHDKTKLEQYKLIDPRLIQIEREQLTLFMWRRHIEEFALANTLPRDLNEIIYLKVIEAVKKGLISEKVENDLLFFGVKYSNLSETQKDTLYRIFDKRSSELQWLSGMSFDEIYNTSEELQ